MLRDLLKGSRCGWCGRDLSDSFLTQLAPVERGDIVVYPVLCICGGLTIIGGGTFVGSQDEVIDAE